MSTLATSSEVTTAFGHTALNTNGELLQATTAPKESNTWLATGQVASRLAEHSAVEQLVPCTGITYKKSLLCLKFLHLEENH